MCRDSFWHIIVMLDVVYILLSKIQWEPLESLNELFIYYLRMWKIGLKQPSASAYVLCLYELY